MATVFSGVSFAEEVTLLYTGQTHAMIYTCSCPIETDGGIARRITLLKKLRKERPNVVLVDAGGFFAGGLFDEYTQNTQLDKERTLVNLKAMALSRYDAVSVGGDEFNFGGEFFQTHGALINAPLLSCNVVPGAAAPVFLPSTVKEVGGVKLGIIGVTPSGASAKAQTLQFSDPVAAVRAAVGTLKGSVDCIVVLSQLGENEDLALVQQVPGIDVLVCGQAREKKEVPAKVGETLIVRASWQGRKMGVLTLQIDGHKLTGHKKEEIRLSDALTDDPEAVAILPRCFSSANCKKEGLIGTCSDPGTLKASCSFVEARKVEVTVIVPKDCLVCNTEPVISYLKKNIPGLTVTTLVYPDEKAARLVKEYGVQALPVYLLGREIERENFFSSLKEKLDDKGASYMIKPAVSGFSYFLKRPRTKGTLEVFLSVFDAATPALLDAVKEYEPQLHFLAMKTDTGFDAQKGQREAEEYLRCVCVKKYAPRLFWDYVRCRSTHPESSWWEDCLAGGDLQKIKTCARGSEGAGLLKDNIALNEELHILLGPAYLLDNKEIFSSHGSPTKEEFKKILRK